MINISEAKDLSLYKKLLRLLGGYSDKFPATGVDKMFKSLVGVGMKVLPKDKRALDILAGLFEQEKSVPAVVQMLLNIRFADLPLAVRPIYKNGRAKEVAFWEIDSVLHDKVVTLLDFTGKAPAGRWVDAEGKKVELLDMTNSESVRRENEDALVVMREKVWNKMPEDFKKLVESKKYVQIKNEETDVLAPLNGLGEATLKMLLGKVLEDFDLAAHLDKPVDPDEELLKYLGPIQLILDTLEERPDLYSSKHSPQTYKIIVDWLRGYEKVRHAMDTYEGDMPKLPERPGSSSQEENQ